MSGITHTEQTIRMKLKLYNFYQNLLKKVLTFSKEQLYADVHI